MMAHDDEILTAYLDGELEPQERREVEARLDAQPELREQLEALRTASKAVQGLPRKKAPASILAAVHGEIARSAEGSGQVIRAGEQFMPAARPSPWRTRLISVAALLAVGVMIFVAVKASLLHGAKEMSAQATEPAPAAVTQSPKAEEERARNMEGKAAGMKADLPQAVEEADSLDRNVLADSAVPAAEPPANARVQDARGYATGKPAEMEHKGKVANRVQAAAEKAPALAKAEATGGGEAKDLQRGNAAPDKAGAPGGFGGAEGAGAGQPARTLDETKVATRKLAAVAKERDGAVAQGLDTGAQGMAKPAAPPPPPAAKTAQELAQADLPKAAPTTKPKANAGAMKEELAEGGEEREQLAMAKAAANKPDDGEAKLKAEFKKNAEAKDSVLTADAPAKKAVHAAPTVVRMRADDPEKARAELLALAAAQGGRELALNEQADKARLRREIGGTTAEADDAQKAGERLVAGAMEKSKTVEPQAPAGATEGESANKAVDGEKGAEPPAELAAVDRKDAKADAEATDKRKALKQEGTKILDRAAADPTGQAQVVRLVLQVPASKKAALIAALQQEANRLRSERRSGRPETLGGGIGHAPEAPKQERSKVDSSEQPQVNEETRREAARQAAQEPRPGEGPTAPAAAAPSEPLEVIEVLIELLP
ncbi:MAG: hypothetical protein L6R28_15070 [Planctomycetes bacterium]|nr:hypothetical protein [Planctomycetota bacterium]